MAFSLLDKFTSHLRNVIKQAAALATVLRHDELKPEHLLYGLSKQKGSIATEILSKAGVMPEGLKDLIIEKNPVSLSAADALIPPEPALADGAKRALEKAVLIAHQNEHKYVGTEHLLTSLLRLEDQAIADILRAHHVAPGDLMQHLTSVLRNTSKFPDLTSLFDQAKEMEEDAVAVQAPNKTKDRGSALDYFCTDLTDEQLQESIDPVIGREREIERLIHILSRRTKNNPVLIGDPGVGKTALVEGLAKRMMLGQVPEALATKRILCLDLSLVVAGTVYRGEFESRIKQIIDEVKADPDIILFIDELHTIIGAGGASGALDAANILKPALAKGSLRCIGATTMEEYHKHIESDAALERRFQPIIIAEPTPEETVEVLRGIRANYEHYHHVKIEDSAIHAATDMSVRYLQDKFLPDKAIDLLDEAAAKVKISRKRDDVGKMIRDLEQQLADVREEKQEAVEQENFSQAIALKDEEDHIGEQVKALREQQARRADRVLGTITEKDIGEVVARITGIPTGDILQKEQKKLLQLEQQLKRYIVGQDEAMATIASCIRRARTGLSSPNRPLGSFIFLGPSGVGKTQTAKTLAKVVFGDEKALLQFDMSEYAESFQASKLIGAPAGYVGYKEGSKLTESVKRKPYAVVLFDEIEKAHPDLFNLFLQILDEGHLTDAVGKRINFKNTIIIFTSNVGTSELNRQAAIGFHNPNEEEQQTESLKTIESKIFDDLRKKFRPEFLNRIDKTLCFKPLTSRHIDSIVQLQLQELVERLQNRGITLIVDRAVRKLLAQRGVSPEQGARRLRRVIQDEVETPLAEHLLETPDAKTITLTIQNDTVHIVSTEKE